MVVSVLIVHLATLLRNLFPTFLLQNASNTSTGNTNASLFTNTLHFFTFWDVAADKCAVPIIRYAGNRNTDAERHPVESGKIICLSQRKESKDREKEWFSIWWPEIFPAAASGSAAKITSSPPAAVSCPQGIYACLFHCVCFYWNRRICASKILSSSWHLLEVLCSSLWK